MSTQSTDCFTCIPFLSSLYSPALFKNLQLNKPFVSILRKDYLSSVSKTPSPLRNGCIWMTSQLLKSQHANELLGAPSQWRQDTRYTLPLYSLKSAQRLYHLQRPHHHYTTVLQTPSSSQISLQTTFLNKRQLW